MSPAPESYDDKPREDYPDREQDSRPSGSSRRKSRSPSPQRHRSSRDDRSRSPAGRRSRSPRRASSRSRSPSPRRMDTDRRDARDSRDGAAPYDPAAKAANREAVANEAAKRSKKDCRVYVGNLNFGVKWNDLKDFMKEAGTVVFAEIMMLPNGMSKGCGVVEFSSPDEAQKSIRELNDHTLLGRPLFIREDREEEARYGAASVSGRAGYMGPGAFAGPPGGRGGYQGRGGFGGGFQPHGFGGNFGHQGGAPPGQGRHLFIKGLPPTVGWQDLKDLFRAAGNVIRADTKIGPDGNPTGMGTAVFESTQEAQNAIAMYNGFEFQGNLLEVKEDRFAGGFGGGRGGFGGFQPRGGYQGGFQQRGGFQGGFNAGRSFGQDVYADYSGPNAGGAGGDPNAGGFQQQQQQGGFHQGGGYQGRGGFGGGAPYAPRGFNASYAGSVPGVGVPPSTQIFVKNLPWSTSNEDLIELFQTTGKVQEAEVLFENGRSKGAGVVQFASSEEAENAIAKFQSYSYGGRPLSLEFNGRFKQFGGGDGSAAKMEE